MTAPIQGTPKGAGRRVAVVVSRFNDLVTKKLLEGALAAFRKAGVAEGDVQVVWVPGAWEIPVAARKLVARNSCEGVVALGAIIQGETTHHEHLGREVAASLMRLTEETGRPTAFGILTTDDLGKALARAGGEAGDKGADCALALLETLDALDQVK